MIQFYVHVLISDSLFTSIFCSAGFPRTLIQAEELDKKEKVDFVLNVSVPDDEIIERIQQRWIHAPSGRVYHVQFNPPKKAVSLKSVQLQHVLNTVTSNLVYALWRPNYRYVIPSGWRCELRSIGDSHFLPMPSKVNLF